MQGVRFQVTHHDHLYVSFKVGWDQALETCEAKGMLWSDPPTYLIEFASKGRIGIYNHLLGKENNTNP